jgi:pimeloyl-ACP methyl ester carboxylesterase
MERCRSADGTVISFVRDGTGPSLVLVHGAMNDHRAWGRGLPALASAFTVYAMDRRGRGESGPFRADHSIERDYEDVLAVVAAAEAPVHLLGHSSGAHYARHAALRAPELASLILYEPPPFYSLSDQILARFADAEAKQDRDAILMTFLCDVTGESEQDVTARRKTFLWAYWMQQALTLPPEMRSLTGYRSEAEAFSRLRVPTLVLLGSESPLVMRRASGEIARVLPDSRIDILDGQGHAAFAEAPDLFALHVQSFIGSLSGV